MSVQHKNPPKKKSICSGDDHSPTIAHYILAMGMIYKMEIDNSRDKDKERVENCLTYEEN